ncbi:MAG: cytochrome C [Gammaproteobacteria bacterium]|nr:cytochrome C [Gammaproteobacteria bacterium]
MKVNHLFYAVFATILMSVASLSRAASIVDTRHNLSISGPGSIRSTTENRVCIFCHTPHNASRDVPYLWNRADSTVNYTTYASSTLYATVGQPTGASKMCLSCHDGTIALGAVLSQPAEIPFAGGIRFLPDGPSKLGTDISDDHPVSFPYDSALAAANGELVEPSALPQEVKLDNTGMLQCTACHDPHDDTYGKFLVMENSFSALCISCHDRTNWNFSAHATSLATWNGAGTDPWPHTEYTRVDENACENCHQPHSAGGHARLLNYAIEEDNCLVCHDGSVAATDIEAQLIKQYRHGVQDYTGIHDPTEDFTTLVQSHVECVDCHNPHRANNDTASAPDVPGSLLGVTGISASNTPVKESAYLYEVCFKCHADNNALSFAEITRQNPQLNTRLEFDTINLSYHPVEDIGQNPDVPSLLSPYTVSSIIYCTDCHNSDDNPATLGIGASGPHGSMNKYILESNYTTADNTVESSYEYAMCYKCHDRSSILDATNPSGFPHSSHVGMGPMGGGNVPCSACHDPHGVTNNTHLINFDINIVSPNTALELDFVDLGTYTGSCSLSCHGVDHADKTYP